MQSNGALALTQTAAPTEEPPSRISQNGMHRNGTHSGVRQPIPETVPAAVPANGIHQNGAQPHVRLAMIGCGGMARRHVRSILQQRDTTEIPFVCEPSGAAYEEMCVLFDEADLVPPPNVPDLDTLLQRHGDELDAAFIITPHKFHYEHARACMESGLDVLLEKPMVMNAEEAHSLIDVRNRTERLLVVAFNGSLSPQVRRAKKILHSGELGELRNIHAVAAQNWQKLTTGLWRQVPEIAGGGFLFDTGAHMLNTITDLADEPFVEVAAWLDNRGAEVDILASVMGRLASGALVTMSACGDTPGMSSDVRVYCSKGSLRTGIWGERLQVQRPGQSKLMPARVPKSLGQWEQFVQVRRGLRENPCPPEVGLRMAKLWDAIQASAAQGGMPVQVEA